MALATLGPAVAGVSAKMVSACGGPAGYPGASIKAFTATMGTGNVALAGHALDLSAIFPNKVLAVVVNPIHDPARTTGDLAWLSVYVPATDGNPATGKVYIYAATGVMTANDSVVCTDYVVSGFAIGY